ncbi:MAG: S9 family peptidase, partial [Bacteroidota bacterium]
MKHSLLIVFVCTIISFTQAQDNLNYQKPSEEILALADAPLAPRILLDADKAYMVLLYRDAYKSIEELSETEMRLAGLRINPTTNIGSRTNYYNNVKVKGVKEQTPKQVSGLPDNPRVANFAWSPDQTKIAFTNTTTKGVEIWVLDIAAAKVTKLTDATVNANMRDVINWFKDGNSILVKMLPTERQALIDPKSAIPTGPTISQSDGKKAQNRTYQDLL